MARYGLEHSKWDRLVAAIVPANLASGRVLEHLGFVYEKHVDYREMTGVASIALDDPIVALYALPRERFQASDAFYRLNAV
jgi:RimJ/RimL family protein N-acetyltransferase